VDDGLGSVSSPDTVVVDTLKLPLRTFSCCLSIEESVERAFKMASRPPSSAVVFGGRDPVVEEPSSSADRVFKMGSSAVDVTLRPGLDAATAVAASSSDDEGARLGSCRTCFAYALSLTSWVFPALGYRALRLEWSFLRMAALFSSNLALDFGDGNDDSSRAGGVGASDASNAAWKLDHSCGTK
jgi:hypothetical protein